MFGAVVAYMYEYLLGITQSDDSAGYDDLVISPVIVNGMDALSGSRALRCGRVSVSYVKEDDGVSFEIGIPDNKSATFIMGDVKKELVGGVNRFKI